MSSLTRRFPEIYRSLITECPPGRLALGAATALGLGGVYWSAASWDSRDPGKTLFHWAFWTQVMILVVYGAIRASASIADERDARTWDLQRLTPLTSGEIAVGKLLGAPVYPAFLAALMLPWALAGAARSPDLGSFAAVMIYIQLAATALLAWSLALTASAYSDVSKGGSSATAGALIGLGSLYTLGPALSKDFPTIVYFGMSVPYMLFMPAATAGFAVWAFLGAKWRIGRDLLEPPRFWRLPALLSYLIAFQLGFEKFSGFFAMMLPAAAVYMAALGSPTNAEGWRRWRASEGREQLDRTPDWVMGTAFCLLAALTLTVGSAPVSGQSDADVYRRLPLLIVLWLVRDAAFIQTCRFSKAKRPEVMALVFLGLSYLLPSILLAAAHGSSLTYLFMPSVAKDAGAFTNLLPGVVWAAGSLLAMKLSADRST